MLNKNNNLHLKSVFPADISKNRHYLRCSFSSDPIYIPILYLDTLKLAMFMSNSSNNESVAKSQPGPGSTGIKVGSYNILGTLGHGNFSVCKLARHTITNHQVAIKCIEKKNLDQTSSMRIYREIEIMKSLDHQNIVKLDQVMESKSMIYLVCEYAERGDIFGN